MTGDAGQLVAARAVHGLLAAARAAGAGPRDERFDLPPVSGHDDELVPIEKLNACSRALMSVAREDVGLAIGRHMPLESTGLWGLLLRTSATYGEMLGRGAKFFRIVSRWPEYELQSRGVRVALVSPHPLESAMGPRHHVVAAAMSHWIAWGRRLTGVDFPVLEARVSGPAPVDPAPWRRFFRGSVVFGTSDDAYLLDAEVLGLPLRESAPELSGDLDALATLLLARLDGANALIDKIERALDALPLDGAPAAERVARRLTMTPRTLQRHLAHEGVTFRELRTRWLRGRAERLLCRSDVSLQEVSYLLGYADPTTFSRAFRHWTGMAPGAWRVRRASDRVDGEAADARPVDRGASVRRTMLRYAALRAARSCAQ